MPQRWRGIRLLAEAAAVRPEEWRCVARPVQPPSGSASSITARGHPVPDRPSRDHGHLPLIAGGKLVLLLLTRRAVRNADALL